MITCPKCKVEDKYYYDGVFIRCQSCGYVEWAKEEPDGDITHLWDKWNKELIDERNPDEALED